MMLRIITSQRESMPTCRDRRSASISPLTCCHNHIQSALWNLALVMHCHQLPERSFSIRNRQIPLCARCFGLLIGTLLFPCYVRDLRIASLLIVAMILDGATQALCLHASKNWLRFLTGVGFAIGCGGFFERGLICLWNM
jgi:uncharacterized membrane protein